LAYDPTGKIVLVGLMGSGKTTIGRRLAARFRKPFHDSDEGIEARTGRSARELKDEIGEDAMHGLEADDLLTALDGEPAVIAAAASTIESDDCRRALASSDVMVVWLRGSPALLASRFASGAHRPSFGSDPQTFIADQARRRNPLFESVQPIAIDIDELTEDQVVASIVERLGID
jgi:shikimate kinase